MRWNCWASWLGLVVVVGGCGDDSATDGEGGAGATAAEGGSGGQAPDDGGGGAGGGPDVTPPTTQIVSAPQDGQGNGVASAFTLSCDEPSCTFECSLDGAPFEACSASPSYDPLPPGEHTFRARATDAVGNVETTPAEHSWLLAFGFRSVVLAYETACAISGEGSLHCWGSDVDGTVGNGPSAGSLAEPTEIDPASDWGQLFAGALGMCAAKSNGALYCWGDSYALGDQSGSSIDSPAPFSPGGIDFASLDISWGFACGLDAAGAGYCIGEGYDGSLGDGDQTYHYAVTPVSIGADTYTDLAVGSGHACAVTAGGIIHCWGYLPTEGVVPLPTPVGSDDDWVSLTAGDEHTCAIKTDGTLFCWGGNYDGQLGLGDTDARALPTQVGSATNWVSVAAGAYTTCAQNADFEVHCWGGNYDGQVGSTSVPNGSILSPALVSSGHYHQLALGGATSCAASQDGHVSCWGSNNQGVLGRGVSNYQLSLVAIDDQFDTIAVAGDQGGCGLVGDQVYCWGYGSTIGQADGLPRPTPAAIAPAGQWSAVAAGIYAGHACGIRAGTVYCWGDNGVGELGNGTTTPSAAPTPIAAIIGAPSFMSISVGRQSTCAITTENDLYCWGTNGYGELGIGSTMSQSSPVLVAGSGWDQISLGSFRAAAHKLDGTFWNWGANASSVPAQLPGTDWASVGSTGFGECGIKQDQTLHCTIQGVPGTFPAGSASWSKIIGSGYPYCALDAAGAMGCFVGNGVNGFASSPALASGDGWTDFEYPSSLFCGLRADNERQCSGYRRFGSLGDGFDERLPTNVLAP